MNINFQTEVFKVEIWIRFGRESTLVEFSDDPSLKKDIYDYKWDWNNLTLSNNLSIFIDSTETMGVGPYYITTLLQDLDTGDLC